MKRLIPLLLMLILLGAVLMACTTTSSDNPTTDPASATPPEVPTDVPTDIPTEQPSETSTELNTEISTEPITETPTETIPVETQPPLSEEEIMEEVNNYNYIIGTQAFSPRYQFTEQDPLFEIADCIAALGSNAIKFSVTSDEVVDRVIDAHPELRYVFMWYRSNHHFRDGYSAEEAEADYTAIYNFTKHLLTEYNGTNMEFYLGHWEGDWYYLDNYNGAQQTVSDTVTQGMIGWINNRQKAVDDAKADIAHENVAVWNYLEINRPVDALNHGYDRVVNRVLPHSNVDYVSYSAYDSMGLSIRQVRNTINYIYENLPEKEGVDGPRVFIGEVGTPAANVGFDPEAHKETNLENLKKYLHNDVKFILYWQMYCNEVLEDGTIRGFWLINDKNEKQPLYYSFEKILADAKVYVADFLRENRRVPTNEEYRAWLRDHEEF